MIHHNGCMREGYNHLADNYHCSVNHNHQNFVYLTYGVRKKLGRSWLVCLCVCLLLGPSHSYVVLEADVYQQHGYDQHALVYHVHYERLPYSVDSTEGV